MMMMMTRMSRFCKYYKTDAPRVISLETADMLGQLGVLSMLRHGSRRLSSSLLHR